MISGGRPKLQRQAPGSTQGDDIFDPLGSVNRFFLPSRVNMGLEHLAIGRAAFEEVRAAKPELFYRMVGHVARRLSARLRAAGEQLSGGPAPIVATWRREHDLLGERELPDTAYYGVQTLRGMENFPLSGIPLSHFEHFVRALAFVKKAAAAANSELGVLDPKRAEAIRAACDEIIAGKLHEHFTVDMIQGGAGTSTNMNANEVIANRALELLGHRICEYQHLHPNDHVNCSQSTNDAYPTAVKLGVVLTLRDTVSALRELQTGLKAKADQFADVLKMGRTENQDAVPMTLGQELGAYAVMIGDGIRHLEQVSTELLQVNMGATAIGTGINSPPGYAELCTRRLAEISGLPVTLADDLVEATQDSGEFALISSVMKTAAVQLSKICNDLRWLSSGPRCGLYELRLPAMQPGSSIMPGKVNPVIPEVVSQVCFQIIGTDVAISMACEASELELNMAEPIIAFNLFSASRCCVTLRLSSTPAALLASKLTANVVSPMCKIPSVWSLRSTRCSATKRARLSQRKPSSPTVASTNWYSKKTCLPKPNSTTSSNPRT